MATIYVRSTDGSNSDDGSTWALAKATLAGADAIDGAGDTIYVSQSHAESTAGGVTWNFAGTLASPTKIICGNDAAEPPTAVASTATVSTTGTSSCFIASSTQLFVHGITFNISDSTGTGTLEMGGTNEGSRFVNCNFYIGGTNGAGRVVVSGHGSRVEWRNCNIKFAATGQGLNCSGRFLWQGGGIAAGGSAITTLIKNLLLTGPASAGGLIEFSGVDLSNGASAMNLVQGDSATVMGTPQVIFRNCKMPSSWSGSPITGTIVNQALRVSLFNCDDGDTNYSLWVQDYTGSIRDETTIVRDGGASDGTTSLSWKMVTTANAQYPSLYLRSPEIRHWNETTGSAITLTVEIVHDSQGSGTSSAFTDKEVWLEAQYLGTSGFPLGSFIDDAAADVLASAADQTSSSVTWTTTGLSTPVKQKLSVTLTPEEKGIILLTVCMAGASDTCYVCPKVTVS